MMPGLAANPSIFENIKLPDYYDVYWLHWIIPYKNELLSDYVDRLIDTQIQHENPILLGVSFGGIVVQEMSKKIDVAKLILVSTVKTHHEFPAFFSKALRYKIYKLFPSSAMRHVNLLEKIAFSKRFRHKMQLYQKYMDVNDKQYLNWAIKTVLEWKQDEMPHNFIHIHGEKDQIFPIKNIKQPVTIVKNGRHDMIVTRGRWFSQHLPELLQE